MDRAAKMNRAEFTISPVEIVDVEPQFAAVVRTRVAMSDMPEAQRRARLALKAALDGAEVTSLGPNMTVWRMPVGGYIDYAPGVLISKPWEETGEVGSFVLPAGRAAHLRLTGAYAGLQEAWSRLFGGCQDQTLSGLNWEIYSSPEGAAEPRTDLYALLA